MFSTAGLFSDIACPSESNCELLNCIFSHEEPAEKNVARNGEAHPSKRMRLTHADAAPKVRDVHRAQISTPPTNSEEAVDPDLNGSKKASKRSLASGARGESRPISPPPLKRPRLSPYEPSTHARATSAPKKTLNETLNPRIVPNPPTAHATRLVYVRKLHDILKGLNSKAIDKNDEMKLSENELITLALDEEEKIGRENASIYSNVVKLRMVALSKMTIEQWMAERRELTTSTREKTSMAKGVAIETGLSAEEEVQLLPHLFAQEATLKRHGFVTSPPTDREVEAAEEGVGAAMGWEECDRCKARFQVFPDRREDGSLTSGGPCTYHHSRTAYSAAKSSSEKVFACCNQPVGSSAGCVTGESHVFKVNEAKRLATTLQFKKTPENMNPQQAVCLDCEMGYTVNGLEMIRMTAISWPEGNDLLDILVKPLGAVLDFNTRFSGVRAENFVNAVPYGSKMSESSENGQLQVVESPETARELLFKLISPSTPLVGHAIDNDLNVTRIVHPSVIDTVVLYPHRRGLPFRPSLKILAKDHLSRDIQTAASGHDSKEDARAAGDLVRVQVAKRWRHLKSEGWTFHNGKLTAPSSGNGMEKTTASRKFAPVDQ